MNDLCPNCLQREIDKDSIEGFCKRCTAERHANKLAGERRWWRVNGKATRGYVDLASASLPELEGMIQPRMAGFVDVGLALKAIRDRRLYRDQHFTSFEAYTTKRWGFGRRHANYQIRSAEFAERVMMQGTAGSLQIPVSERHVRELMRLDDEEAAQCWSEIVALYPPEAVTLELITAEVNRRGVTGEEPGSPARLRLERLRRRAGAVLDELEDELNELPWDEGVGDVLRRMVDAAIRYLSVAP